MSSLKSAVSGIGRKIGSFLLPVFQKVQAFLVPVPLFRSTQALATCGMLVALEVVLRWMGEWASPNNNYTLAFIAAGVAAYLYGPVAAALVHGLGDLLKALLIPRGVPHLGFTLVAVLIGFTYGLLLYRKRSWWRIGTAVLLSQVLFSFLLNTYWLLAFIPKGYGLLLLSRLPQLVIMTAIQLAVLPLVLAAAKRLPVKP